MSAAIEKSLSSKLEDSRQAGQARLVKSLREYKTLFAVQHRTSGRLIYPESLKLLPLYVLAINKSLALRGGFNEVQADERSAAAFEMMIMPVSRLLKYLYPSLYRIEDYLYQVINSLHQSSFVLNPSCKLHSITRTLMYSGFSRYEVGVGSPDSSHPFCSHHVLLFSSPTLRSMVRW